MSVSGKGLGLFPAILVFGLVPLLTAASPAPQMQAAEDLYQRTEFQASLALLDKQSSDSATNFLLGRDYFMLGDFKKASDYLQRAASEDPSNSEYMDWVGRAWGKRAETSNPLMAPAYASRARQAFEAAVRLNSKNTDALSDLFDSYFDAPGFLGGGYDKAAAVADQIAAIDPPEGYSVKAKLAQKRQQYPIAEQHLRQAIATAPKEVGLMIALAKFLANQGRNSESDAVFAQAQKVNPNAASVWFARADVLIKQKRNLNEAKILLQKYMQAKLSADDPSRQEAAHLLKEVDGV